VLARLDRYVLKRAIAAFLLIVVLVVLLVVGMDLILRLKILLSGDLAYGESRWLLIAQLYGYSLPTLISPLLPFAVTAAAVMATAPMLKRGEFTALASAGTSMRRATRGLLILAVLVGSLDVWLSDQVAPRWETRRQAIEDRLGGEVVSGRIWDIPETGSVWYANHVVLQPEGPPIIEDLVIAPGHGLIHARALERLDGAWVLTGPIVCWFRSDDGRETWESLDELPCEGQLALPFGVDTLSQRLVSRHAMTGGELLAKGGHLNVALFWGRMARFVVPVAAMLLVLSVFIRFSNRSQLVVAGTKSLGAGFAPMLIVATGTFNADASALPPVLVVGVASGLALIPGIIVYSRWRL
jgi:lipopolysaccharide export LptBFGC system permease protein LptF